ncbi:MAG: hypothetical protein OEW12_09810 [Deltaproteobacteria bacterium]|nr:hypothetical protein [Deltaproteobacteria bacterium]
MDSNLPSLQFPEGTSLFTLAMARALEPIDHAETLRLSNETRDHLTNLIQGRMLEYLADQICHRYSLGMGEAKKQVIHSLLSIFSDEFFTLFRSKIQTNPDLLLMISRRIIRTESQSATPIKSRTNREDGLFPAIFRKYFEYTNLNRLQSMVESDSGVQKIILLNLLKNREVDPKLIQTIQIILDEDTDGLCPNLFMEYAQKNNLDLLLAQVKSGGWRYEMESLRQRLALLMGG